MRRTSAALLTGLAISLASTLVSAHISIASGPGFANTTQEVVFGVGHGCAGADTFSVRVEIPAGVTSVRPLTSDFGKVTLEKDATGVVTGVVWQKAEENALESDTNYYKLAVRLKVPNQPFTTLRFPTHQTCRAADGGISVVDWVELSSTAPDGGEAEPAPTLSIVPARKAGWNKFTVPVPVADLGAFFGDALIVWKGNAAYSANTATADLIKTTADVTPLTGLAAGDEVWVKY
ncbi:MAG TPA: YcnI family protein [Polyangiaceae bacterium]|nr:YcnI family protein [Polyangiaceae bacterium]